MRNIPGNKPFNRELKRNVLIERLHSYLPGNIRKISCRLYSDFLMSNRLNDYGKLIETFLENGFEFITIAGFHEKIANNRISDKRYVILRHDIDSDKMRAGKFFLMEKQYGVKASYYFRIKTLCYGLMREISGYGSEVGYHYEELATFWKRHKIKTSHEALLHIDEIKADFIANFSRIEKNFGVKIKSVASHGDFINRKLKIPNSIVLKDNDFSAGLGITAEAHGDIVFNNLDFNMADVNLRHKNPDHIILKDDNGLRAKLGITVEAYDDILFNKLDCYLTDTKFPVFWLPHSPLQAAKVKNRVCILTHPAHWGRAPFINLFDALERIYEDVRYGL